jgi:hypothetical protein
VRNKVQDQIISLFSSTQLVSTAPLPVIHAHSIALNHFFYNVGLVPEGGEKKEDEIITLNGQLQHLTHNNKARLRRKCGQNTRQNETFLHLSPFRN